MSRGGSIVGVRRRRVGRRFVGDKCLVNAVGLLDPDFQLAGEIPRRDLSVVVVDG